MQEVKFRLQDNFYRAMNLQKSLKYKAETFQAFLDRPQF